MVPLLFTHDDLDGIGGVVMARARYGDQLEFRRCSTSQINDAVAAYLAHPDGRPLLFTDISVNEQVAVTLDRYAAHVAVRLLDHHQTALWLTRYPWATVRLDACGTMLAYEALTPGAAYAELARVIDDYDRWQQRDPRSSELNRLFEMIGADRFLRRFVSRPEPDFTADERLLLDIESERLGRYLEKVAGTLVEFDLGGQRWCVLCRSLDHGGRGGAARTARTRPHRGYQPARPEGLVTESRCDRCVGARPAARRWRASSSGWLHAA